MTVKRIAIIGGGIIGLSCAHFLRRSGADVVVFESARTGQGASKGNAGWVVPAHASPLPGPGVIGYGLRSMFRPASPLFIRARAMPALAPWLLRFAASCTAEAAARGTTALTILNVRALPAFAKLHENGVRFELHRAGLLYCFTDAGDVEHALDDIRAMKGHGYVVPEVLEGEAVRRFEPMLSSAVVAAFFVPNECHVDPVALTAALRESLVASGVAIREDEAVTALVRSESRVEAVRTSTGTHDVDAVIFAAGARTGELLRKALGVSLPIQAGKGYSFTVRPGRVPAASLSFHGARVAVTPVGDRVRLAGTMELSGINEVLDRRRIDAIHASADRYFAEGLPSARENEWVGMRPLLPDGLPVIGRLRRFENAIVATGHGMLGITQGPATGELVAQLIADRAASSELDAFSPRRFGA